MTEQEKAKQEALNQTLLKKLSETQAVQKVNETSLQNCKFEVGACSALAQKVTSDVAKLDARIVSFADDYNSAAAQNKALRDDYETLLKSVRDVSGQKALVEKEYADLLGKYQKGVYRLP